MEFEGLKGWKSVVRPFNLASRLRLQPRRQQVEWNLFKDSPLKYFEPTCDPTLLLWLLLLVLLFVRLMLKQVERKPLPILVHSQGYQLWMLHCEWSGFNLKSLI